MDRISHNRLVWKCRRGLLELDLVLERFLRHHGATLEAPELAALGELLDAPDPELWAILNGRSEDYAPRLAPIVARLRAS